MSVCLSVNIFSVKDFSATTWVRILKFGTKFDNDELYCATKNSNILLISPVFVHFSFSPVEISVIEFSAPIGARVFKFCTPSGRQSVLCKRKLRC